jgi:hypothetical protein
MATHVDPSDPDRVRLHHLLAVAAAEERNLLATGDRLFGSAEATDVAKAVGLDPVIAERVEAFIARFSRLQDLLGDKLLPLILRMSGEEPQPVVANLDRAERYGWLDSADAWLRVRKLRNRLVHEYVDQPPDLAEALADVHASVPAMCRFLSNLRTFAAKQFP